MTSGRGFKRLIPLFFFLFLWPACAKSSPLLRTNPDLAPYPVGNELGTSNRPWEQLEHIPLDWIEPRFSATVTDTHGLPTHVVFNTQDIKKGASLVFRPHAGTFQAISYSPRKMDRTIEIGFTFSPQIDPSSGSFSSHNYFNGEYTHTDHEYQYTHKTLFAEIGYTKVRYTLKPTDTWYYIFVFRGMDGKNYQYRTPNMEVANAL